MALLKPFKGLRPKPELVEEISSVPYDVVNRDEAKELAKGKPKSFLRVIRSEIEFDQNINPYDDAVYERARMNFQKLIKDGDFIEEPYPSIYIYQLKKGDHSQTGVVGCSSVDEYDQDLIKKHEKTRTEKENDRTRHIEAIGAHSGPVFLTYKASGRIKDLVKEEMAATPLYDFELEDGVCHRFWKAKNHQKICDAFKNIPYTYIADGHHRAASASRARDLFRKQNKNHKGDEPYNFFLSVLFPHDELKILAYNRVVKNPKGLSTKNVLEALEKVYKISSNANPLPSQNGKLSCYLEGKWYGLSPFGNEKHSQNPVENLDVSILYQKALAPIFGIGDPKTDKNIDFVGGIRGTKYLEKLVDSKQFFCAFSVYPTSINELLNIADQGLIMAPKSTWFEPKLRSGLIINKFI